MTDTTTVRPTRATAGKRRGGRSRARAPLPLLVERAAGDLLALTGLALALGLLLLYIAALPLSKLASSLDRVPDGVVLRGFYGVERNNGQPFRWTGPRASLALPLAAPGDYRLTLTMQDSPAAPPGRAVAIQVNGRPAGTAPLEPVPREQTIRFSADPAWWARTEEHLAVVTLDTPAFTPPGDPRPLGGIVANLTLEPVRAAGPWQPAILLPPILLLVAGYCAARVAGASVATAASLTGGVVVALAAVALGERRGAFTLAALPGLYPLGMAVVLALLSAVAAGFYSARRARQGGGASPDAAITEEPGTIRPGAARRDLILFLFLVLCAGFFVQKPSWNEYSRFDLVRALVDDRTTSIDSYHSNTQDKAFANGHYRSDKAPGSALLGVPVYALWRGLTVLPGIPEPDPDRLLPVVALVVSGLPTALLAVLLVRFLRPRAGEAWALAVGAGYALGTIAFPFATLLFGHAAAAFFLFAAFVPLASSRRHASGWPYILSGFLAGWAVLVEYPAVTGVAVLLVYAARRERRAPLLMVVGALPPAALLLAYNQATFGNPFTVGYAHLTYGEFAAGQAQGLLGITLPRPASLHAILIGPLGLLRLSPWLIFAVAGAWAGWRRGLRGEVAACAAIVGAFLVYNAAYYAPLGGQTPGPRFLTPALPFAAALVGLVPRRYRPFIAAQLICAAALALVATATEPKAWETLIDPLGDFWLPRFLAGQLGETSPHVHWGLQGWQPLLALGLAALVALAALLTTARPQRRAARAGLALTLLLLLTLALGFPLDARPALASITHPVAAGSP